MIKDEPSQPSSELLQELPVIFDHTPQLPTTKKALRKIVRSLSDLPVKQVNSMATPHMQSFILACTDPIVNGESLHIKREGGLMLNA